MVLALGECANLQGIDGIRTRLLEAFDAHGQIELDMSGVGDADLSFLQVIEAARKLAEREGKCLSLAAPASTQLRALLGRAGMLADDLSDTREFWLKGEVQ